MTSEHTQGIVKYYTRRHTQRRDVFDDRPYANDGDWTRPGLSMADAAEAMAAAAPGYRMRHAVGSVPMIKRVSRRRCAEPGYGMRHAVADGVGAEGRARLPAPLRGTGLRDSRSTKNVLLPLSSASCGNSQ